MSCQSSMSHLPPHLITDVLSRLPIKSILFCRCVCKLWFELLSTNYFINHLYPSAAPITLLLHPTNPPARRGANIHPKSSHLFDLTTYTNHSVKTQPNPKAQVNRRRYQNVYQEVNSSAYFRCDPKPDQDNFLLTFEPGTNLPNLDFGLVNSCKGLLSLYEPETNDPIYVCNPVSGEFITLPKCQGGYSRIVAHGFGYSQVINKYKVVRVVQVTLFHGIRFRSTVLSRTAQVYTLGEGTTAWRSLGDACKFSHRTTSSSFLNGTVHWDTYYDEPYNTFNLDTERFGSVRGPRLDGSDAGKRSLGVVRGCLSVCRFGDPGVIEIWVMKEYGIEESWTKDLVVFNSMCQRSAGWLYCKVLMVLESGEVLMVLDKRSLVLCDPERQCFRVISPLSQDTQFEVVAHIPTIASLKDVAPGENVQVYEA